jgi:hypothetical protein
MKLANGATEHPAPGGRIGIWLSKLSAESSARQPRRRTQRRGARLSQSEGNERQFEGEWELPSDGTRWLAKMLLHEASARVTLVKYEKANRREGNAAHAIAIS